METKKKLNEGCLKIFEFLKLLYEDQAYYNDVIEIFKDDLNEQSANNIQVILNKYINTLKVFGIKVEKRQHKFELLSNIYSMNLSLNDLKAMSILMSSAENYPDNDVADNIFEIIKRIQLRMNNEDKNSFNNIIQTTNYNFTFQYMETKEQIEHCRQLCKSNQMVSVIYIKNKKERRVVGTPQELVFESNVYFKVCDSKTRENVEIPISNILRAETMHQVARPGKAIETTIVFKLKNRLAKTYRLKEDETSNGFEDDGSQIIISKESPEKLLNRLMRYSYECEILTPRHIREDFIEMINKTLSVYE